MDSQWSSETFVEMSTVDIVIFVQIFLSVIYLDGNEASACPLMDIWNGNSAIYSIKYFSSSNQSKNLFNLLNFAKLIVHCMEHWDSVAH